VKKKARLHSPAFPSLQGQGYIGIDLETKDPDLKKLGPGYFREGSYVAGVAVGTEAGFREYYPIGHEEGPNLPKGQVAEWLRRELSTDVPKVGANIIYDLGFLRFMGVEPKGPFYDIQVAEPLIDENRLSYSLEALSQKYLGAGKFDEELNAYLIAKYGRKNPKSNIWRAPSHIVKPYAVGDVEQTLYVFRKQIPILKAEALWDLFEMECSLIPMLLDMRVRGVHIDVPAAKKMHAELTERQEKLQKKIGDASVWAAAEIALLFDRHGMEYPRTPKTKAPSITADFLKACPHPLAKSILEVRQLDKLRGTFLEGVIFDMLYEGSIHTSFNQLRSDDTGAVSGRFSSSLPNLQFIPSRTEDGKRIRSLFVPDKGCDWGKLDFSQVEFRLAVNDAIDCKLGKAHAIAEAYQRDPNLDYHQVVADMCGVTRTQAKTINFGILYGEGAAKLSSQLGLDEQGGRKLLRKYHLRVPFAKPLSERFSSIAKKQGYVVTLYGRRRRFEKFSVGGKDGFQIVPEGTIGARRAFVHKALNARIQGSAADVMKLSMLAVYKSGVTKVLGVPHLTVHDELDYSIPRTKEGREAFAEAKHLMETCVELNLPLKVDSGVGPNWGKVA